MKEQTENQVKQTKQKQSFTKLTSKDFKRTLNQRQHITAQNSLQWDQEDRELMFRNMT